MNLEEIKNDPEPWLHDDENRTLLIAEVERLEAELAEAEKEIHERAAGEQKEWEEREV